MRCWSSVSVCTDFVYSPPTHRSGDRAQRRVYSSQLWRIGYTIVMVLMGSARGAMVEAVWRRTAVVGRGSSKTAERNICAFTTWQSTSTHSCRDDARSVNFFARRRRSTSLAHSSKQPMKQQVVKNTYESEFLDEVEGAVDAILLKHQNQNILDLPPVERESLGVATPLRIRMDALTRNGDCRRCWLQRAHCICHECPGLESESSSSSPTGTAETNGPAVVLPSIRRLFLLTHHKEICLAVDTAKMILAAFPQTCRLVVSGMGPEYQPSMSELMKVLYPDSRSADDDGHQKRTKCLVLFPSEDARTFQQIVQEDKQKQREQEQDYPHKEGDEEWDIVVIDGTWSQARKMYNRYIPPEHEGGPIRVKLSNEAVALLEQSDVLADPNSCHDNSLIPGHQLRRHPIKWREVSTLEATRLLLRDIIITAEDASDSPTSTSSPKSWDTLASYQIMADKAAQKQLGPPRRR
eukprot:scaffold30482_cov53-Attheya_sp.AAC.3